MQCVPYIPEAPTAEEYLAVVDDSGISRPMLSISEVEAIPAPASSRAAASMQPMELSEADALAIEQSFASGSARPRIKIAPLPPYQG